MPRVALNDLGQPNWIQKRLVPCTRSYSIQSLESDLLLFFNIYISRKKKKSSKRRDPHFVHGRSGGRVEVGLEVGLMGGGDYNFMTRTNKSHSEGFSLQLVQDGLNPLHRLLPGLPEVLLALSLHRVENQQLFGQ